MLRLRRTARVRKMLHLVWSATRTMLFSDTTGREQLQHEVNLLRKQLEQSESNFRGLRAQVLQGKNEILFRQHRALLLNSRCTNCGALGSRTTGHHEGPLHQSVGSERCFSSEAHEQILQQEIQRLSMQLES